MTPRDLSRLVRRGLGVLRLLHRLVRLELAGQRPGRDPQLWRRGFLSDRRLLYPGIEDPAVPYLSDLTLERRLYGINSPTARLLMTHKLVFAETLLARGLGDRGPEVYGTARRGAFRPRSPQSLQRLLEQADLIVKPLTGRAGRGVRRVTPDHVLSGDLGGDEVVVQQRLAATPEWAAVNPTSLNTTRLLTVRPLGSEPVLAAAVQLFGTAGSGVVDNLSAGGICSRVDLTDGTLGPAVVDPRLGRRTSYDVHPDTGHPITGIRVPGWPALRELAHDLMTAFPEADHVGWDLCLTPDGPRVVEGNAGAPSLSIVQVHGPFLDDPAVRRFYAEHGLRPS